MCYTKIFERQVFNPIKKKFQPIILFYITPTFKQEKKTNSCLYSCYKIEKKIKKGLLKNKKTTAVYIAVIK